MKLTHELVVYLPDTRDVRLSPYGKGNLKLGPDVFTYSRLAGRYGQGTCPGSTDWCEEDCYAKRISGPVRDQYLKNSVSNIVPPIPAECRLLRIHVSGDFDRTRYIKNWTWQLSERPDVTAWAYTRSWRVPELLPALERLRALPNVQLFASMDESTSELPPSGWRIAWIDGDPRCASVGDNRITLHADGFGLGRGYVCPEETGRKADCQSCAYCFLGKKHDVVFLRH